MSKENVENNSFIKYKGWFHVYFALYIGVCFYKMQKKLAVTAWTFFCFWIFLTPTYIVMYIELIMGILFHKCNYIVIKDQRGEMHL